MESQSSAKLTCRFGDCQKCLWQWPALLSYAMHKTNDRGTATDFVADAFSSCAIRHADHEQEPHRSPEAFRFATLRGNILHHFRDRRFQELDPELPDEDQDLLATLPNEEILTMINKVVSGRPVRDQRVFWMRIDGAKLSEIATKLNIGVGTAHRSLAMTARLIAKMILNRIEAQLDESSHPHRTVDGNTIIVRAMYEAIEELMRLSH